MQPMNRVLCVAVVVSLAVAGLTATGNADSEEQAPKPVSSPAEDGAPPPAVESDPGVSSLGPLESIQAQAQPAGSLPAPREFSCGAGRESISLSWQAVEGADQYQVLLSGIPWAVTVGTAHRIEGLPENTRLEVGVQAGGGGGWGTPAAKVCATRDGELIDGASASDIPTPSGIPNCASSTADSITISWNAVADSAVTGYKVTASVPVTSYSGRLAGTTTVSGRETTSAKVTGLNPFSSYIMAVRAIKGDQEGVGTGGLCSTKAADMQCLDIKHNSITVDWSKNVNDSSVKVYQWYSARAQGEGYTDGRAVSGTTTSTVFTGLDGGTS